MEKETALEILRKHRDRMSSAEITALGTLIPELAESEDEKIRKEIIEYLNEREILEIHTETKVDKRWISWLEKQKPLHQCADYYNSEGELKMPRISDFENELANILFEREYDGSTETEEDIQRGKLDYEFAAIQLAPRLLSLSIIQHEWSEEDEHRRTDAIYFLETAKKHYASTIEIDATIEWLKSLKPQPYQNPSQYEIDKAANEWNRKASFSPIVMTLGSDGNPNGTKVCETTHADSFKAGVDWLIKRQQNKTGIEQED